MARFLLRYRSMNNGCLKWVCDLGVIWTVLAAGCGDDVAAGTDSDMPDAQNPGDGGDAALEDAETVPFLTLCAQPELYCERLYECAEPDRLEEDQEVFGHTDVASCIVVQDALVLAYCQSLEQSWFSNRVDVDLSRLGACYTHLVDLSCYHYVHGDHQAAGPCEGSPFVSALVSHGSACGQHYECLDEADVCSGTPEMLGICEAPPGEDNPCVFGKCASGLRCIDEICRPIEGATCIFDHDCDDDTFWCDQPGNDFRFEFEHPGEPGVCAARALVGSNCEDIYACAETLHCDDTNGYDEDNFRLPGHCVTRRSSGEPCNEPADCTSFDCVFEGATGTCA